MTIIKCKMCGGELKIIPDSSICECEYCGSKQTIPTTDDEKRLKLYERANKLRSGCEFDKAAGVYESIVSEYQDEAEAYWGLVLCKYGIEYVDDPKTGKKIPTCHRSSFDSVMDDSNFELVMENSDVVARGVYREEAKQIEELRKSIVEVSSKEEPYDIFICYKETDDNGQRTVDSVIAQDVYDALVEKDYKVFFSRITLEDKLGQEYEPYIFAALNSAKVMLAFGTTYDYYNAVWVKNEWSRFLQLMESGQKKTLIPCFKDIDAYDMPKEFARLQAQDMGKVGAIQDLLRGIDKIFDRDKKVVSNTVIENSVTNQAANDSSLCKRGFLSLEERKYDRAKEFFERALDINPENGNSYLGIFLADENCSSLEEYVKKKCNDFEGVKTETLSACEPKDEIINSIARDYCVYGFLDEENIKEQFVYDFTYESKVDRLKKMRTAFSSHGWTILTIGKLDKVERFADEDLKRLLDEQAEQYLNCIDEKIEEEVKKDNDEKERICKEYDEFVEKTKQRVEYQNETAQKQREERYAELCKKYETASSEKEYKDLQSEFRKMLGYKESNGKADECGTRIKEIKEKVREESRLEAQKRQDLIEKKEKISKVVFLCIGLAVVAVVALIIVKSVIKSNKIESDRNAKVEAAEKLMDEGKYSAAIDAFNEIDHYAEKEERIKECVNKANDNIDKLLKNGKIDDALNAYYGYKRNDTYVAKIKYDHPKAIDVCDVITELRTLDDGQEHNLAELYKTIKDYSKDYNLEECMENNEVLAFVSSLNGEWECVTSKNNKNNTDYLTGSFLDDDWLSINDGVIKTPDGYDGYYYDEIKYIDGDYYQEYLSMDYSISTKKIIIINDGSMEILDEYNDSKNDVENSITWKYKKK